VTVFCTGKGDASGALTAKIIREKLRHCRSRQGAGQPPLVEDPNAALNNAERLAEAASRLRRSEQLRSLSGSHLERAVAEESVEAAKSLLEEAEAAEERAWVESHAAHAEAFRFGLGEPWPPADGAAELDRAAREQLELARHGLSAASNPTEFEARIRSIETRLGKNA
jgi:Zn-dependent M28 family amino/carboxypeptidase